MPPTVDRRAARIVVALAVLLAGGMLTLGVISWFNRGQQAPDGLAVSPTPNAPTQPAATAVIATPTAQPRTATTAPSVAPTATSLPATVAATAASSTATTPTGTRPVSGAATPTPDLSGPGHVSEPDPAKEAQRQVVATVGAGGMGDRVAALLDQFYPLITRAYAENNPELLRPLLDDDAYEGYVQDIKRTNSEPEVIVPVYVYRVQPKVFSNGQDGYAVNVAVFRYDRDLDAKTRQVLRVSRPFRACARWYLIQASAVLKIEGGTFIPERYCDAGWPEPPVPSKG